MRSEGGYTASNISPEIITINLWINTIHVYVVRKKSGIRQSNKYLGREFSTTTHGYCTMGL